VTKEEVVGGGAALLTATMVDALAELLAASFAVAVMVCEALLAVVLFQEQL
jgi:hypothetical protein